MRAEIIDYLIRHKIGVTEENIRELERKGLDVPTIDAIVNPDDNLDAEVISKIYDYTVGLMSGHVKNRIKVSDAIKSTEVEVLDRLDRLSRNIEAGLSEIHAAQILEKNMSGYVDTVVLDFSNPVIFDQAETTATITDDLILGVVKDPKSNSDKETVRIKEYTVGSLSSEMRSSGSLYKSRIEKINDSGIGHIAMNSTEIINNDSTFQIISESEANDAKKIELVIDKKDQEYFNQVEIGLARAHLAMMYTSEDGLTYTKAYSKPKYIKNTVIPITGSNARYIKIVFSKNKNDYIANGKNGYRVRFNYLNILKASINETAVIETNDIQISGGYSSLCLSTCCNYSDKNIDIDYKISLDGQGWQNIRPVAKLSKDSVDPIIIPINNYSDNKMISLTDYDKIGDSYVYSLSLPVDFVSSNRVRVFEGDISDGSSEWRHQSGYYTCYGMLSSAKTIELGNTSIEINGKWVSGTVELSKGLYSIRVVESSYAHLINSKNATVISDNNGEYVVKDKDGILRTIHDVLYPYNHKVIIEKAFDFLFYRELIEKDDYTLYNNETGFNVSTQLPLKEVILTYKLYQDKVSKLKLRAEMKSLDKNTIPYIEKAFIRLK